MLNSETVQLAREIYNQTRSIHRTFSELKRQGYVLSERTLTRWSQEYQFKEYCTNYDKEMLSVNAVVIPFESTIKKDLIKRYYSLSEQLDKTPEKESLYYAYKGIIQELKPLLKLDTVDESAIIEKCFDAILSHPSVGPVLRTYKDEIIQRITRRK